MRYLKPRRHEPQHDQRHLRHRICQGLVTFGVLAAAVLSLVPDAKAHHVMLVGVLTNLLWIWS